MKNLYTHYTLYIGDASRLSNGHYDFIHRNHFATHLRISNTMRQLNGVVIEMAGDGPLEVSVGSAPADSKITFEKRSDLATVFSEQGILFRITSGELLFCCTSLLYCKGIEELYRKVAEKAEFAASFPMENGIYTSRIDGYLRRSDQSEEISSQMVPADVRSKITMLAGQRAFKQISEEVFQEGIAALQFAKLYAVKGVRVLLQPIASVPMDYDPDSSELSMSFDRSEYETALYSLLGMNP